MRGKYRVVYATRAVQRHFEHFLNRIPPKQRQRMMDAVSGLADNPRPYKSINLALPVSVYELAAHYRLRVGDYRILYDIDDAQKRVFLLDLRKRDEHTYRS